MSSRRYAEELEYLYEFRRRVAEEHSELAPFLANRGNDPDVERLFEGFAFLTSSIRERVEDEFPELVQGLLAYWWPQYLRALPSMCVMRFQPIAATPPTLISAGTGVQSVPVDETNCVFRTTRDFLMLPFTVAGAAVEDRVDGATLALELEQTAPIFADDDVDQLPLYLHCDENSQLSLMLAMWLERHAHRVELMLERSGETVASLTLPGSTVGRGGFTDADSVVPDAENTYPGYRLLQEYFAFPDKFKFVHLSGLRALFAQVPDTVTDRLIVRIEMNRRMDRLIRLNPASVQTNCVTAVNVFEASAHPIRVDHSRTEYVVEPDVLGSRSAELYAVDRVRGGVPGVREDFEYLQFESMERNKETAYQGYYRCRNASRVVDGKVLTFLSLRPFDAEATQEQVLSVDLRCTNGDLPSVLNPGDIRLHTPTSPGFANFSNLTKPTGYVPAPTDPELLWQQVANLSLNYRTILNDEALHGVISAYDPRSRVDKVAERKTRDILAGLRVLEVKAANRLYRGAPVRGIRSKLVARSSHFAGLGDLFLFASVLERFFGLLVSVNSFHELGFLDLDTNETLQWRARIGQRSLL